MSLKAWNKANHERVRDEDKKKIRIILNLANDRTFPRCPGKSKAKLRKFRENSDYSHDDKTHICDECRCEKTAGEGTGGDFYNIGRMTGHYGIGFCVNHECRGWSVEQSQENARVQLELIRSGVVTNDADVVYEGMRKQKQEAVQAARVRKDIELVVHTLEEFKDKITNKDDMTEYISGGRSGAYLAKMSDHTRMKLALEIAKTLAKMNLDYFKIDKDHFLHVDEIKIRIPRMIDHVRLCLVYMKELMAKYNPGDSDPAVLTMEKIIVGFREIWSDARTV